MNWVRREELGGVEKERQSEKNKRNEMDTKVISDAQIKKLTAEH